MPRAEEIAARLESLGALHRLSESLRSVRGALLTREDVAAGGLCLAGEAALAGWSLEEAERAYRLQPSTTAHDVGEHFTAALGEDGRVVHLSAVLAAATCAGGRVDVVPAGDTGVVVVHFSQGIPPVGPCSLVDSARLALVAAPLPGDRARSSG